MNPVFFFVLLMTTIFFVFSIITLTVGPISAEAVPVRPMATASGLVIGFGEISGGGVGPSVSRYVADRFSIQ
ncbi:hypothetical protein [Paraburkholderia domus]|uniref:hypothetical protein n=1 Tax=Paraburkholderia domus TaxID=2793075 RepID=UPI001B8D7DE9|nr:hypothetical protein [Paraburkholderia domus]